MTAAIFLVCALAMTLVVGGRRNVAIGLFAITLIAAGLWLDHHMTDSLALSF